MKKNDRIRRVLAAVLAALLLVVCPVTQGYAAETDTIRISTAEDLAGLARRCALDTWSRGKTVLLENDLTLDGASFLPIPTFGGTFDGQSHTIRGVSITDSLSPAGLFGEVQSGGVVKNLTVEGTVAPSGDAGSTGGIAGINSGVIEHCRFTGTVSGKLCAGGIAGANTASGSILSCRTIGAVLGERMTGGIVGDNEGLAAGCSSDAYVNAESIDPHIDLEELDLSFTLDLSLLSRASTSATATDTGGIAGYSSGTLSDCVNRGTVGYQHIGYNTGGVVGRSCGQLLRCCNEGTVCGRKDVGGIAGQIEPYIQMDASADYLSEMNRQLYELRTLTDQAADDAQGGADGISGQLDSLNDYIEGTITDPKDLVSAIHGFGQQLDALNRAASGSVGDVTDDIRAINNKFHELSNTALAAMAAVSDPTPVISDTSQADVSGVTLGKTSDCVNTGDVSGDVNTGGITGAMAIEYELDPEDDVSGSLSGSYRRQYEYKAILYRCSNTGGITAKRSYTGGICGRMDLGLILECEGYGSITSENGSYVGGIAGVTAATVRSSYAKCSLSGKRYVGGIVGAGVTEKSDGSSSTVADCWSLVDITACQQYEGAVSGGMAGTFQRNYFVSDTLAAINRQSYAGQAEPADYETMAADSRVPDGMKQFSLTFVSDGEVLSSCTFRYGDSFDSSVFPDLPEREGAYAHWDRSDLRDLRFDTVVTAVYDDYLPALSSEQTRGDGRPVVLAEGAFSDGDNIAATALTLTPEDFHAAQGSALACWLSYWQEGQMPPLTVNRQLLEQWRVSLPDDGQTTHRLRYLPPEDAGSLRLYVNDGSGWQPVSCDTAGSYLVFSVDGSSPSFAVAATATLWYLPAGLAAVVLAVLALCLIGRHRRRKKAARPPIAAQAPDTPAEETPAAPAKKTRRWLLRAGIAAGVLAAAAAVLLFTGLGRGLQAYHLLAAALREGRMAAVVSVQSDDTALTADAYRAKVNGTSVTTVQWEGVTLYCANGTVYLENGRAYGLDTTLSLRDAADLFRRSRVQYAKTDEGSVYTLTLDGGDAAAVTAPLPKELGLSDAETLTAALYSTHGKAASLSFAAGSAEGTPSLTVRLDFTALDVADAPEVPEAVQTAIQRGGTPENTILTRETLRLLKAWAALRGKETLAADLTLTADCGPLVFRSTLQYDRRSSAALTVSCVRSGTLRVYFAGDKLCDDEGRTLTTGQSTVDQTQLIELIYQLVLRGDAAYAHSGETERYTLTLDADAAAEAAAVIAPDIQSRHVTLTGGSIVLVLQNGQLRNVSLACGGTVRVAVTETDAALGADIRFIQRNYPFPQAVLDALK